MITTKIIASCKDIIEEVPYAQKYASGVNNYYERELVFTRNSKGRIQVLKNRNGQCGYMTDEGFMREIFGIWEWRNRLAKGRFALTFSLSFQRDLSHEELWGRE